MTRETSFVPVLMLVVALALGCSADSGQVVELVSENQEATSASVGLRADEIPLIKGPASPDGSQAIFATPDLGIGENRVGFVLTSPTGLIRAPAATVSSSFFPGDGSQPELKQRTLAVFHLWPYGTRGIYATRLTFDAPGRWGMDISVQELDGTSRNVQMFFDVKETAAAPSAGTSAVRSRNKTINDVKELEEITTGSLHDPDLYQLTIADAVANGLPTVVVMASPAFCTNAVCGPQVEVLQELKNEYKGQANFIHVDFYENPMEIQGDLGRARPSPTVVEWRLPSTEWSFVIDRKGIVTARFESFATLVELRLALQEVL